ncbi:keratin-associated protein 19-2-like [Penaeus chinensis]|uniref:keratin-associated protein 19-2-like n=1 Tax=Penaeus chinensis TaxID=139456 RepID=UPI001FB6D747|nr:keratin-associated protein 19-2-like [Penaeus chinensis]
MALKTMAFLLLALMAALAVATPLAGHKHYGSYGYRGYGHGFSRGHFGHGFSRGFGHGFGHGGFGHGGFGHGGFGHGGFGHGGFGHGFGYGWR